MRMKATLTIAAAALLTAAPAVAQNTGEAANTADMNAVSNAETPAAVGNAAAPPTVETNTTTAETMTTEPAPAPEPQKSFPWGVVGLLGLLGLIPRARRNR
jgi:MYXO-CTERM domain-containing protein